MSTNPIAAAQSILVSFAADRSNSRQVSQSDNSNSEQGSVQGGGRLFTALFDALTQFVTENSAAAAATANASSAASTGTSATAPATAASTPITTTAAGTSSTGTSSSGASSSTSSSPASSSSSGTSANSLGADLQAFLHDLFAALRQAGDSRGHEGHGHG